MASPATLDLSTKTFIMKWIAACYLLTALCSCVSHQVTTTWKAEHISPPTSGRVVVVAILPDKDSLTRKKIEKEAAEMLESLNYQAVSAVSAFGPKGLSGLGEETTYSKLCSNGIDAVMIIALVHKTKQTYYQAGKTYRQPHSYYYDRIWNYKRSLLDTAGGKEEKTQYFWESILFDLSTLEALHTARTKAFAKRDIENTSNDLAKQIIKNMVREKVLNKQEPLSLIHI